MDEPRRILQDIFGYPAFRSIQEDVISSILNGHDTLAIMPTGGGKSLCYQVPALLFPGITVVVSPLISLMTDQLDQLRELGISAGMLNSSLDPEEYIQTADDVRQGKLTLLYAAPETLLQNRTIQLLQQVEVSAIAVDEAHCISEWGHDFRPEYRQISRLRSTFPEARFIALTATATEQVREDIVSILNLEPSSVFTAGFDRPNLFIDVEIKSDAPSQALEFVRQYDKQPGIIYCFSRKQVDQLYADFKRKGIRAAPYHAGLSDEVRQKNQELFRSDDVSLIIATVAFGMGINKPDIRFILHYDMPQNLEAYYQQIGRAGRDGLEAHCRTLFGYADIQKINYFINQKEGAERESARTRLDALLAFLETRECRRRPLLEYFSDPFPHDSCGSCDNCISPPPEEQDHTVAAQKFMSCMLRMEERYGASLIIDILRGSSSEKVKNAGGTKVSTWGIGKEYSRSEWKAIYRTLTAKGLVATEPQYRTLSLTSRGAEVLKGKETFTAHIHEAEHKKGLRLNKDEPRDNRLFELLRTQRKELAQEEGVPPYAIFPDKTLIEMARFLPETPDDLLMIHGVGKIKLQRFGEVFLTLIRNYVRTNDIELP